MHRSLVLLIMFGILISAAGCTDQVLTPPPAASPSSETGVQQADPFAVLGTWGASHPAKTSSFGLIQGLAAAPNGDIMVADLFAGVGSRTGGLGIALPGVTDIGPIGRGALWATVGPDDGNTTFEDRGQALYRASKGTNRKIANLFAFENAHNPDGLGIDSNPYDVEPLGGRAALVVDAAGNDLLRVDNRGRVDVLAVFPKGDPVPVPFPPGALAPESVPTSVAIGPDGHYYVGELTGFPAAPGISSIWRVAPGASWADCPSDDCQKAFDGGFTSIIDLAFGPDGQLYVAELDESTWLAFTPGGPAPTGGTINRCDLGAGSCSVVADGIFFLTAITFGTDGTLWATADFATRVDQP